MTGSYSLVIKKSAERELRTIPKLDLRRVTKRLRGLAQDPRPTGSEKLSGHDRYRVRQGDYRIVYAVDDETRTVQVVKVGHRREVYRK
ncbi:MAG: type II toxin-antitoxin system RelE/ParE family toxin [Nitrospirales bacterium]|nr:type II toxin-antitoxin system RelE/ParE family toxin [Nitrospirales bacterium]